MVDAVEKLREIRRELQNLDTTIRTVREVKIDVSKIKQEITDDIKREMQGKSSYGLGV